MRKQYVIVEALVPEFSEGHPEHPIVLPPPAPPGIWGGSNEPFPGYGLPGQPPGIWGPTDPRPGYGLPGQPPGTWGGSGEGFPTHPIAPGGPPPGIWGPTDPRPGYGLPGQPPGTWGGAGEPFPGYGLPGQPPGIWGPTDPFPGYGLPGRPPGTWGGSGTPMPTPPIYFPGPPVDPGYGISVEHPEHPIYFPPVIWPEPPEGYPGIDPDQIPKHPELPDLRIGAWSWVKGEDDKLIRCFIVPNAYVSNALPGYTPTLPPEEQQPGKWVIVLLTVGPNWAWVPSKEDENEQAQQPA